VYELKKTGSGLASWTNKYAKEKFQNPRNAKERYAISDCRNDRHRQVMEFLIPILYLEKPTRITVTFKNNIWGALEDRVLHWGRVIAAVMEKLVEHITRNKFSSISPYLFHLYHHSEVLNNPEVVS